MKEKELEERLLNERKGPGIRRTVGSTKHSQMKLLAGAVKRKAATDATNNKKVKDDSEQEADKKCVTAPDDKTTVKSGAVGLLGLVDYGSDSDSDQSS